MSGPAGAASVCFPARSFHRSWGAAVLPVLYASTPLSDTEKNAKKPRVWIGSATGDGSPESSIRGIDLLPANTPAAIQQLVRRCLEKDPRRRLQAIGEARLVLEWGEPQITTKTPRWDEKAGLLGGMR